MINIRGYRVLSEIYESQRSIVVRAVKEQDNLPVVIKVLREEYPSPEEILKFQHEFEIVNLLKDHPGVIRGYSLEPCEHSLALILEDFGAESLKQLLRQRRFSLEETLDIGARVAAGLSQIHGSNVMHKDINPSNILYNPITRELKIIDFGTSTVLSREMPEIKNPEILEGTLLYISPEQTGRMNRSVDYRTDFYSLGATLYELLTERPPFNIDDPQELIHCHIAKQATPPHVLKPDVPERVSQIVMKLLSKAAEQRYKSARGLQTDLERCLTELTNRGSISEFPLGAHDISNTLLISQQIFGREQALKDLRAGFERVCLGKSEWVLIRGEVGMGKSALLDEIHKSILKKRGFFLLGEFTALQQNTPYSGLSAALQKLVHQLLTESETQLRKWKERILKAVASNAGVIMEVIPELRWILGEQPQAEPLPPAETSNRFNRMMQRFIAVFAKDDHPLVLCLENLEWADAATLSLLRQLMTCREKLCLYIIGTCRDSAVAEDHPLLRTFGEVQNAGAPVSSIQLLPLSRDDINQLLGETLARPLDQSEPLADEIARKTQGNPLFVNELLQALWRQELLWLDPQAGVWQWDLDKIKTQSIPDDVANLMFGRIREMGEETQRALRLGACCGTQFDLQMLSHLLGRDIPETAAALESAISGGLIVAVGDFHGLRGRAAEDRPEVARQTFRFIHDRLQQAAYELLPAGERGPVHWKIGQRLLGEHPIEKDDQHLFDIVRHLNLAMAMLEAQQDRDFLAHLNLLAGRKSKTSAAFLPALGYFKTGIGLLAAGGWQRKRELALLLHQEAAEASLHTGDFDSARALCEEGLGHTRQTLEKACFIQVRIDGHVAKKEPGEAVCAALTYLAELGIRLPEAPSKAQVALELMRIKLQLVAKKPEALLDLPEMDDPVSLAAVRIMRSIALQAYMTNLNLMALLILKQLGMVLKQGHNPWSPSIFGSFGLILAGPVGDPLSAYRMGKLSLELLARQPTQVLLARTYYLFSSFVAHFQEHLKDTLPPLHHAYLVGVQNGDFEYAALCAFQYCQHQFYLGKELLSCEKEFARYNEDIRRLGQQAPLIYSRIYHQTVLNLMGRSVDPCVLTGTVIDEPTLLVELREKNDRTGVCAVFFNKLFLCCLLQDYPRAVEHAEVAEAYSNNAQAMFGVSRLRFFSALSRLRLAPTLPPVEQSAQLKRVAVLQRKLKQWADLSPQNHLHLYWLIEAEKAKLSKRDDHARDCFDKALRLVSESEFAIDGALASELAGEFYLARGQSVIAKAYLADSRYAYQRWGAEVKVKDLETRHRELLGRSSRSPGKPMGQTITRTSTFASSSGSQECIASPLELLLVSKTCQSISEEIALENLLQVLLDTLVESADAERGYLILEKAGDLQVRAQVSTGDKSVLVNVPIEEARSMALSVVRFVARTREGVALGDAAVQETFSSDPHIAANRPKSVLCLPLLRNGNLIGIVYLENNQATEAFTPANLEFINLLLPQAAISLDNAQVHSQLKQESEALKKSLTQAQETAQIKSEFLAKTNHELRTPLNSIINLPEGLIERFVPVREAHCELCETDFELEDADTIEETTACPACSKTGGMKLVEGWRYPGSQTEIVQHLKMVVKSGRYLLQVVNDVLDISKLEAGRLTLMPKDLNLKNVVEDIVETLTPLASERRIRFVIVELPPSQIITADKVKLGQILVNLLGNAIKFSPDSSTIEIDVSVKDPWVFLSVRDHGVGIAKENHEMIFEGFRQVAGTDSRKYGGTGLGLAITKNLVDLHGGTIWVESELGQGTAFFIQIPIKGPSELQQSENHRR